jgi:DNA repair protein RadC
MKKMKDLPRPDRPREKIAQKGAEALSDQELIEAIIGKGNRNRDVRALAREIACLVAEKTRNVRYEDLRQIEGIGPTKAAQVMACFELGRRCFRQPDAARAIQKPEDVIPLVAGLGERRQEHFISITLNGAGEVIATRTVTIGILNHSLVHPREVFADAITDRAASIICVHNHPSGSLDPSPQDIAITRQLQEAGAVVGIQLIDHIIVTKAGFCSMKERGLL